MTRIACLLALLLWIQAAPAATAPLAAYGKLPSIETAVISPSGHAVAVVVTNGEQRTLVVRDLGSGAITLRGLLGDHKIRNVQWAGDKRLVIVHSATSNSFVVQNGFREWFFANMIDLTTKKMTPLMRNSQADLSSIFDYPIVRNHRGDPAVFVQGVVFSAGRGRLSLFRIDTETGANRLVEEGSPETIDWVVDPEGRPLAQELYNPGSGEWTLRMRGPDGWRDVVTAREKLDRPFMVGLGRDGGSVVYAQLDENRRWRWRQAGRDGTSQPLDVDNNPAPIRAALDGRMIGHYLLAGDEDRYTFHDPADARAWQAIVDAYAGQRVRLESWSTDRRRIVVLVESGADAPRYAVVDLCERRADWLGAQYVDLTAADVSPRQPVRFKAADGLSLTGYLTTPRGKPARNLPLIVFPHGGPASRDTPDFDWWAQGMASRGYAVLQVNFRGSEGLGRALLEAGYGQWGRKMQTDLSDGVRHLAAQGAIDPKRVCIVGASYGGYAALAGPTLDRGVYRCAVSFGGVSDLRRLISYSQSRSGADAGRYWRRFMGVDSEGVESLAAYSPALNAEKADAPILLIHGRDDTVVPVEQSQIMAAALQKAGKPVELVVQKGADHWLSRGETRLQMLTATMAFVEKHNPPN
ncbi:MAG: S9 family peptidase [Phenylobacterium sp.]|uniref:alpha/beta hydrolase family protein n=1 Tax=Phenylobacterium sp. TaxID=1871053 RepID=UPI001A39DBD8|nr:S9 family peptidase [Phenylobacterium sp.]MBL8769933.1 S9 family peptidase [Phenylobacterium sp.]